MFTFGAADAFDAHVYGESHPSTIQYLSNQVSNISDTITGAGRQFIERSKQAFEHFNGSNAINFARKVVQSVKNVFNTKHVVKLWELDDMQKASMVMQRWIMANPSVRDLYHRQQLDGYSDTYIDIHGSVTKEDHYDYRRVMNGVMVETPDDWYSKEYLDEILDGDRELLHEEQVDIIHTWNAMDLILALGQEDPTSPSGGSL